MKAIAAVAVAALVLIPVGQAVSDALPGRVSALERQVKALNVQVKTLTRSSASLAAFRTCISSQPAVPLALYGNGTTEGYVYAIESGARLLLTSALDIPDQGQPAQVFVAAVNQSCLGQQKALYATGEGKRVAREIGGVAWR